MKLHIIFLSHLLLLLLYRCSCNQLIYGLTQFEGQVEFRTQPNSSPFNAYLYYDWDNHRERLEIQSDQSSLVDIRLYRSAIGSVHIQECSVGCFAAQSAMQNVPQYFVTDASQLLSIQCTEISTNVPENCRVYENKNDDTTVHILVDVDNKKIVEIQVTHNGADGQTFYSYRIISLFPLRQTVSMFSVSSNCAGPLFCYNATDVVFLVDGSESITDQNFEAIKQYILNIATSIGQTYGDVRLAVFQFSHHVQEIIVTKDKQKFHEVVSEMERIEGLSSMFHGLRVLSTFPWRDNARKVVFVISDGNWNFPSNNNYPAVANSIKNQVDLFGVLTGYDINQTALASIVSEPTSSHLILEMNDNIAIDKLTTGFPSGTCSKGYICEADCNQGLCACGSCICPAGGCSELVPLDGASEKDTTLLAVLAALAAALVLLAIALAIAFIRRRRRNQQENPVQDGGDAQAGPQVFDNALHRELGEEHVNPMFEQQ